MNLQIHHVISNIVGTTGLAIIDALLAGERNTETLAAFRDPRIRSSQETIAKSLVGDYRDEHFFTLRQALESFRHCQKQIAECDQTVKTMLAKFDSRVDVEKNPLTNDSKPVKKRNDPLLIRNDFYRISGVDLTAIPGIQAASVSTILSEIGTNVSRFPTAKHFASWLGLCPTNKISGGRILSSRTQPVNNRASTALRIAATTLLRSPSALGQYLRRMRAKLGMPKAVTATAHKLARIIYHLLKTQQSYDQSCFARFEEENNRRQQIRLKNQAKSMGFALVPL